MSEAPGAQRIVRHRVGVVVLNFNGAELTQACVRSVLEHTAPTLDYAVLVVDNGSTPPDRAKLAELAGLPRVQVVASRFNLGFGAGHMYGTQFLEADEYLFLNSDCLFRNDALSALSSFLAEHPRAALASGLVTDREGRYRPNYHPAPNLVELLFGRTLARRFNPGRYPDRRRAPAAPLKVEVVGGAALYARAEAFFSIGGFDPSFFLYCEEEDLAWRLRRAGWEIWVVPAARLEHAGGASTPPDPAYRREFFVSFLHYFRKHRSAATVAAIRILYCLKLLRRIGRDPQAAALAWFVLRGAKPGASLRFGGQPRRG